MKFYSTKNKAFAVTFAEAVFMGIAPDEGLFMPQALPQLPRSFFYSLERMSFQEIAYCIAEQWIGDEISPPALQEITAHAFTFTPEFIPLDNEIAVLELFHGPTLAFKDFGARFLARIMSHFLKEADKEVVVLAATSGDTGGAVAHGFLNAPGIRVMVLYPSGQVSTIQEKQFTTLGNNITALEMKGTFDDCQRLVKQAFMDPELHRRCHLTSANSINVGRLLPQLFYYFYAYGQIPDKRLPSVFSVPSGNFGNLTAGLLAKKMGLPISRFIAATNANRTVPKFLETGVFKPRASQATISNAMDVGNPSNFARMEALYKNVHAMREDIAGCSFSDAETHQAIKEMYDDCGYLLDPHSAIAYRGLTKFLKSVSPPHQGVFLATAHPAKFIDVVEAIIGEEVETPERLHACLKKEKQTIVLPNNFSDLKEFLLGCF